MAALLCPEPNWPVLLKQHSSLVLILSQSGLCFSDLRPRETSPPPSITPKRAERGKMGGVGGGELRGDFGGYCLSFGRVCYFVKCSFFVSMSSFIKSIKCIL